MLDDVATKFAELLQAQIEESNVVELLNHYERITADGYAGTLLPSPPLCA